MSTEQYFCCFFLKHVIKKNQWLICELCLMEGEIIKEAHHNESHERPWVSCSSSWRAGCGKWQLTCVPSRLCDSDYHFHSKPSVMFLFFFLQR